MRKFLLILLAIICAGCVSVSIPHYLNDKHPYQKKFYLGFKETAVATEKVLRDSGWIISGSSDPTVYEQNPTYDPSLGEQTLLFTDTRQTLMILFSRYTQLNVYLRSFSDGTEVEIRYIAVTPIPFKNFTSYRNDRLVRNLFNRIDRELQK